MGMNTITLDFLDLLASKGENKFSTARLRTLLMSSAKISRGEVKTYVHYLIDTGLVKNIGGEIFEIDNELRLKMRDNSLAFTEKRKEVF